MSLLNVIFGLVVLAGIVTFLIIDSRDEPERLMSALGVVILVLIGFIFSAHPAHIRWRSVFWGLGLEFTFGLLVLRWETGATIFQCIGDKVTTFLGYLLHIISNYSTSRSCFLLARNSFFVLFQVSLVLDHNLFLVF